MRESPYLLVFLHVSAGRFAYIFENLLITLFSMKVLGGGYEDSTMQQHYRKSEELAKLLELA